MLVSKQQVREALSHFRHKYNGNCCPPKKGEWYLKPTQTKRVFELLQAENDFARKNYIIINPNIVTYLNNIING